METHTVKELRKELKICPHRAAFITRQLILLVEEKMKSMREASLMHSNYYSLGTIERFTDATLELEESATALRYVIQETAIARQQQDEEEEAAEKEREESEKSTQVIPETFEPEEQI